MKYDVLENVNIINQDKTTKTIIAIIILPFSIILFIIGVLLLWVLVLTVPCNDCDFEKGLFAKVETNIVEAPCNIINWARTSEILRNPPVDLQVLQ